MAADIGSAQRSACRQIAERRQQTGMAGHAINSLSGEMAMRRSKGLPKDMEKWDDEQIAEFWERHNSADYWDCMEQVDIKVKRSPKRKPKRREGKAS